MAGKLGQVIHAGTGSRLSRAMVVAVVIAVGALSVGAYSAHAATTYWVDICANNNQAPSLESLATSPGDGTLAESCGSGSTNTLSAAVNSSSCASQSCPETAAPNEYDLWVVDAPSGESIDGMTANNATYFNYTKINSDGPGVKWGQGFSWLYDGQWSAGTGYTSFPDCLGNGSQCDGSTGPGSTTFNGTSAEDWGISCSWVTSPGSACNDDGSTASLQGWRLQFSDPNDAPQISFANGGSALVSDEGHWVDGVAHNGDSVTVNPADPGGICSITSSLVPQWSQDGTTSGSPVATDSQSATDYDSADDSLNDTTCNGPTAETFAPDLATLSTGAYVISSTAENPADLEGTATGATANDGTLEIDNNTPTLSFSGAAAGGWTPSATVRIDASDGSEAAGQNSGIASTTCTDADNQSWMNGTSNGNDDQTQSVTLTLSKAGTQTLYCTTTNGVGSTSAAQTLTVKLDPQLPKLTMSQATQAPRVLKTAPTFTASASEAVKLSGADASCQARNATTKDTLKTTATAALVSLKLTSGGKWTVTCTARTGAGRRVSHTEHVDLAPQPLNAALVFVFHATGDHTHLARISFHQPPAGTRWTVKLTDGPLTIRRTATSRAAVRALVSYLEKQTYVTGEHLIVTLSRVGYLPQVGNFTMRFNQPPAVTG
jgi:hypothetical protein